MKKFGIASLLLIIILGVISIFYFDLLNLKYSKEAVLASIVSAEDTRRVTGKFNEYLSDPDPEIRRRAALAVGRIGDNKAASALFKLLEDSVAEVAETAAFSIGLTGERKFLSEILDLCADYQPELLAVCIQSVGRLSDSSMTDSNELLASYLTHVDHRVREQAAYAVWRAGYKDAEGYLVDLCRNDPVRPVRIAALYALVRMKAAGPVELYADWIPDSDPYVRMLALRGMALSGPDGGISIIASGLNDRDNDVVAQAVISLGEIGSDKAIDRLVSRYAVEEDEKLKVLLLETFARLETAGAVEYAHDDINEETSSNIKAAAVGYLAKIEKREIIPLIDSLADLNDAYLDTKLAAALGEIGGEVVKPRLAAFFNDSAAAVRAAAFEALCEADVGNVDYYLRTALADEDMLLRASAVEKIGELKKYDYLGQLMSIMKLREKADVDVKRAIVETAAKFLENDADSLVEDILYHALLDEEYIVSRDAAAVYKDKLGVDKSAFVAFPSGYIGTRKIKSLFSKYRDNPTATIVTRHGDILIELFFDTAPLTVNSFISLAREGFFDGLNFHRVVPAFVVQGGDPRGDGWGGPGYSLRCEYSNLTFKRGAVGMAHSGRDTGGSQFFITLMPQTHLDARYTLFGQVISGMQAVDQIVRGDIIERVDIEMSYEKKK